MCNGSLCDSTQPARPQPLQRLRSDRCGRAGRKAGRPERAVAGRDEQRVRQRGLQQQVRLAAHGPAQGRRRRARVGVGGACGRGC